MNLLILLWRHHLQRTYQPCSVLGAENNTWKHLVLVSKKLPVHSKTVRQAEEKKPCPTRKPSPEAAILWGHFLRMKFNICYLSICCLFCFVYRLSFRDEKKETFRNSCSLDGNKLQYLEKEIWIKSLRSQHRDEWPWQHSERITWIL